MRHANGNTAEKLDPTREEIIMQFTEGFKAALAAEKSNESPVTRQQHRRYIAELRRVAEKNNIKAVEVIDTIWPGHPVGAETIEETETEDDMGDDHANVVQLFTRLSRDPIGASHHPCIIAEELGGSFRITTLRRECDNARKIGLEHCADDDIAVTN